MASNVTITDASANEKIMKTTEVTESSELVHYPHAMSVGDTEHGSTALPGRRPLLGGGFAQSSPPTIVAAGTITQNWNDLNGRRMIGVDTVEITSPAQAHASSAAATGVTGYPSLGVRRDEPASWAPAGSRYEMMSFDPYGRQWTRTQRENRNATLFASAARTASDNSADQTNEFGKGLMLFINCTAIVSSPSVTFTIKGKDPVGGLYYTILQSAAIVGTGLTVLRVYPGIAVAANVTASDILPKTWRVEAAHGNGDSITYSVAACVMD